MIGIRVQSVGGKAPDPPVAAWFGTEGGDIGRNAECTLALMDPERHISRKHASVHHRDGRHYLRLLSAGLPVEIDGRVLHVGEDAELLAGQRIRIGGYDLEVLEEPDSLGLGSEPVGRDGGRPSSVDQLVQELHATPRAAPGAVPAADTVDLLIGDTGVRPAAAAPAARPATAAARPPPASAGGDAGNALLAGLGLGQSPAGTFGPEQWQLVGALLRTMTEGTLDLLTARMVAKRELGANATQLRSRENNPLKFSPDVDAALAHLLGPAERGFLPPLQAAREAFDDLRAHQVALLAGMRAALDSVMARFDPVVLEQRMAPGGAWESLIPSQRKARLWAEYSQQFAQIVNEVEGDFDALLGRAFLKAYQAQLAELVQNRGTRAD
jgi:FHA domain-containing protein